MRAMGSNGAVLTRVVALLLVVCLAECAAGSCLSYGHSCWGAHGKRSGKASESEEQAARSTTHLSDWYLSKLLRKISGGINLYPTRKMVPIESLSNNELSAILQSRPDNDDIAKLFENEDTGVMDVLAVRRENESEENPQVKAKLIQIMKEAADEKK